jgi:hypothetical protein
MHRSFYLACPLAALTPLFLTAPAHAAPEEVQIYMDEMSKPGEIGLDIHLNHVLSGDSALDYPGAESAAHRMRVTPEFSLGLGHGFELGAYLPLATLASDGVARAEGAKLRLKWLAPRQDEGFYWGANLEVGHVSSRLDQNPWNGELKMIAGWRKGCIVLATNGNFDFTISGPQPGPITFDLDVKAGYKISKDLTLGIETYHGFGALRDLGHVSTEDQTTYLVVDTHIGKWDINAGLGKGYGGNRDSVVFKLVLGVPLPKISR